MRRGNAGVTTNIRQPLFRDIGGTFQKVAAQKFRITESCGFGLWDRTYLRGVPHEFNGESLFFLAFASAFAFALGATAVLPKARSAVDAAASGEGLEALVVGRHATFADSV